MAEEKQIPLEELLFGPRSDEADKPDSTLAQDITAFHREGLARKRRDQAAHRPSLPQSADEGAPGGPFSRSATAWRGWIVAIVGGALVLWVYAAL